ncbi:MAG: hypothetical protein JW900_03330 [Anaerolineae bacterium]|nr:hypothetical protein [Anaerolineae bacterium]
MMVQVPFETPKILTIHLQIANYPVMADEIRRRMREELFRRGVITAQALEEEVRAKAALSQVREGLPSELREAEPAWELRLERVRDYLTDFYFAYNLPIDLFEQIIDRLLDERSVEKDAFDYHFNPELAPFDLLLKQAEQYAAMPLDNQHIVQHHLEEIMVVLIKTIVSDHLGFLSIAKQWFTAEDMRFVRSRRIGTGKVGGKAAGMLLAWRILQECAPEVAARTVLPESYFIGTDVFYEFLALNRLEYFDQKYKPLDQIRAEYPRIVAAHERGHLHPAVLNQLQGILERVGQKPLIVRSSSLLEDNFGTSFAGKYESHFCPNQGSPEENLRDLSLAIRRVYASAFNPDVMLYRRQMKLLDYDERMAILLQEVQGQAYGRYYFPALAGVAFSQAPILWHPRLRREDGFLRMVVGLGTRAVNRVADDYPRMVVLSHPLLRPETTTEAIRRYSQHLIDLIDLEDNAMRTLPVDRVIGADYPALRLVAEVEEDGTITPIVSRAQFAPERLVLTADTLLQKSDFVPTIKTVLSTLESQYAFPVDIEFAITRTPELVFHLLQCRPQSSMGGMSVPPIPSDLPEEDKVFGVSKMVPQGLIENITHILYVDPLQYSQLENASRRQEVARLVSQLNAVLETERFIMLGPGRWGSVNPDLGVPVSYADIYNTRALVEISVPQRGIIPEPSYGTHFFQDLVEAGIYPLAIYLGEGGDFINQEWLARAGNQLVDLMPEAGPYADCIRVIHVPSERAGHTMQIVMDGERGLAYTVRER